MRIHLLQHMLSDYAGHWCNETLGWIAAAREAAVDLQVYASATITPDVARLTGARGVYELTADIVSRIGLPGRFTKTPEEHSQPLINFMAWSETFREACGAINDPAIGPDDLLAVPFATLNEVHGMALWLESMPMGHRPAVLFNFHQPHYSWQVEHDRDHVRADFMFSRYAGRRLRALLPKQQIILTTAEPRLRNLLQHAFQLPCHMAPMLMNYCVHDTAQMQTMLAAGGRPLTISVMGDFREEKGSLQMIDALSGVAARIPDIRFFIQVRVASEADALRERLWRSAPGAQLDIQVGPSSTERYVDHLRRSDLVFLPYSWQRYAIRTSGVFAEALAYGLPVVVPARTWMADQLVLGHGAGEIFSEWTPAAMSDALLSAVQQIAALSERARSCSSRWRKNQSIKAYLPRIIGLWRNGA